MQQHPERDQSKGCQNSRKANKIMTLDKTITDGMQAKICNKANSQISHQLEDMKELMQANCNVKVNNI